MIFLRPEDLHGKMWIMLAGEGKIYFRILRELIYKEEKKMEKFTILAITLLLLVNCNSIEFKSPKGKVVSLGDSDAICDKSENFWQWYILYGAIPINKPDMDTILLDEHKTFRIQLKTTAFDLFISTFVCFFTSITKKTIEVEYCGVTSEEKKKLKQDQEEIKNEL
jgi:hypothetical protein